MKFDPPIAADVTVHFVGQCACGSTPELTTEECTVGYMDGRPQCRKAVCRSCGAAWWVRGHRVEQTEAAR